VTTKTLEAIRRLHAEGLFDSEIAERLGFPVRVISDHRQRTLGLPSQRRIGSPLMQKRDARIRELFAKGYNDIRISIDVETSLSSVEVARKRLGLYRGRKGWAVASADTIRRLAAAGLSTKQMAQRLGRSWSHIERCRRNFGVPGKSLLRICPDRLRELVDEGLGQRAIAAKLGCNPSSVCLWMKRYGIPPSPLARVRGTEYWRRTISSECSQRRAQG
jgi:hypothetical protein